MLAQMEYTAIAFSQNTISPSPKVLRLCFSFSTFFFLLFGLGFNMCNTHPQLSTEKQQKSPISLAQQELAQDSCSAW